MRVGKRACVKGRLRAYDSEDVWARGCLHLRLVRVLAETTHTQQQGVVVELNLQCMPCKRQTNLDVGHNEKASARLHEGGHLLNQLGLQ